MTQHFLKDHFFMGSDAERDAIGEAMIEELIRWHLQSIGAYDPEWLAAYEQWVIKDALFERSVWIPMDWIEYVNGRIDYTRNYQVVGQDGHTVKINVKATFYAQEDHENERSVWHKVLVMPIKTEG